MDRRGSGFKKILNSYEFQEHYTEDMKPEFRSSNSEFWLILKNLNYSLKDTSSDSSGEGIGKKMPINNADKKVPIKTQQQLEKILQHLSEQSECTCKDVCTLLEVQERRARRLLQELQEQGRIEAIGANKKEKDVRLGIIKINAFKCVFLSGNAFKTQMDAIRPVITP